MKIFIFSKFLKLVVLIQTIILLSYFPSYAQFKQLLVPLEGQQNSNWCWAASLQMVMGFHEGTVNKSQCSIAKLKRHLRVPQYYSFDSDENCCLLNPQLAINGNFQRLCGNNQIDLNTSINTTLAGQSLKISVFDAILWYYGYTSNELHTFNSSTILSWDQVQEQIDECRPFILILNPGSGVNSNPIVPSTNHAVVAKGYHQVDPSDSLSRFVIINDPWVPWQGSEYYIPYEVFQEEQTSATATDDQLYLVNSVLAFVNSIHPEVLYSTHDNAESCASVSVQRPVYQTTTPNQTVFLDQCFKNKYFLASNEIISGYVPSHQQVEQDTLFSLSRHLNENKEIFKLLRQKEIRSESLEATFDQESFYTTNVYYISNDLLLGNALRTYDFVTPLQTKEVINNSVKPAINSLYQFIDGTWKLRQIGTHNFFPEAREFVIEGDTIILSNAKNIEEAVQFDVYKFPPHIYEFYSFNYKGKAYFTPAASYSDFEMEYNEALTKNEFYKKIQKQARSCYSPPNFFDKIWDAVRLRPKYFEIKY